LRKIRIKAIFKNSEGLSLMKFFWKFTALVSMLFTYSAAFAEKIVIPPKVIVPDLAEGTKTRPVQLSKLVVKLSRGEPYGRIRVGLFCIEGEPLIWKGGRTQLDVNDFDQIFEEELDKIGFDAISPSSDLFDTGEDHRAEFLVAGTIKSMVVDVCFPNSGFGDFFSSRGSALMDVEWQIFNRLDRKVVDSFRTRTGFEQKRVQSGGIETVTFAAFAENVRALAASGKLQKFLIGSPVSLAVARSAPEVSEKIALNLPTTGLSNLTNAIGSTVLVQSGGGHGSGLLVSTDGYFLTNYHVVGLAKYVKLRWSDGIETLGEVVRLDRGRDIALIKGESRGRAAFRARQGIAPVGISVFAIGAPLDRKLQNTVTRGIVSAQRVLDGYNYVQSDASVAPGDSGGPLIDDQSDLVAITVAGIRVNDAPQGLNFFIPAAEALSFLGIVAAAH
jgi:serine protease Do